MKRSVHANTEPAFFLFLGGLSRRDLIAALLLCLVSASALYFGVARWPDTPDGLFHLQRVRALSEALRAGVLYPRWFPDFAFEYGHPILNYYAPAFYYPPALLELAGVGAFTGTRLTLSTVFGLSGIAMYALLRLWVSAPAALGGTVVYLVFPYRLYDLYLRGALPEFAAFFWLPLLILIAVLIARTFERRDAGKGRFRRRQVGIAVLGSLFWAGLILTHNLTALMAAVSVGLVLLLVAVAASIDQDGHRSSSLKDGQTGTTGPVLVWGLISLFLGVLLAAWYVMPALWESPWVGIGADPASAGYRNHFVAWQELFTWSAVYVYPSAADPTVPMPGWVLFIVIAGLSVLPLVRNQVLALPMAIGLVLTVVSTWLTTDSSAVLWTVAAPVLGKLQFPWRWQSIVAVGVALLVAVLIEVASDAFHRKSGYPRADLPNKIPPANSRIHLWSSWLLAVAIVGYVLLYSLSGLAYPEAPYQDEDLTPAQMWAFDAEYGQIGMTWAGEFLPRWVEEQRWAIGRGPSDGSSAQGMPPTAMTVQPQRFSYLNASYNVSAAEPTTLIWHRFYFPAWHVSIDGQPAEAAPLGSLGQLSVVVPTGEHEVAVRWRASQAVWFGRLLALLAWTLVSIALFVVHFRRGWLVGWIAVGVIFIVVLVLPLEQEMRPTQVGANYGSVRLEAASTPPANAGDIAPITLQWLVVAPSSPLTAFVHVVDEATNVVAQYDAPLAGDYTPSQRWLPGLLIDHTFELRLPEILPPGNYVVKAGVYEPGNAASPLVPAGQDDPRVDIGILEVRP